jgi:hypothetical protein
MGIKLSMECEAANVMLAEEMHTSSICTYICNLSSVDSELLQCLQVVRGVYVIKLSLCLSKYEAMMGVVSFTPRSLYRGVTGPGTHWGGGCVGPRAGLDAVAKGKNSIIAPAGN